MHGVKSKQTTPFTNKSLEEPKKSKKNINYKEINMGTKSKLYLLTKQSQTK